MKRLAIWAVVFVAFISIVYNTIDTNNTGLKVLSWIKKVQGNSVNRSKIDHNNSININHLDWDKLLRVHVDSQGGVDYNGFLGDRDQLDVYLNSLSLNPPKNSSSDDYRKAYWINAYNAFTVELILDHYPIKSIKDISDGIAMIDSPWDIKFFKIGGVKFDLNTIEHEILRKEFNDPRIHFVINCASVSCPKLLNQAYIPEKLEAQLENQSLGFINNESKNRINEESLELSKIFNWFKVDFDKHGGVKLFLQKYTNLDFTNASIQYMEYDWGLNNGNLE